MLTAEKSYRLEKSETSLEEKERFSLGPEGCLGLGGQDGGVGGGERARQAFRLRVKAWPQIRGHEIYGA